MINTITTYINAQQICMRISWEKRSSHRLELYTSLVETPIDGLLSLLASDKNNTNEAESR